MKHNRIHHRGSIRIPDYDYSQPGAYFITMITHGRDRLFGEVRDGKMQLTEAGQIVWEIWNSLPGRYPQIGVGTACVMPDHFHGIVNILPSSVRAFYEMPLLKTGITQMERRRW